MEWKYACLRMYTWLRSILWKMLVVSKVHSCRYMYMHSGPKAKHPKSNPQVPPSAKLPLTHTYMCMYMHTSTMIYGVQQTVTNIHCRCFKTAKLPDQRARKRPFHYHMLQAYSALDLSNTIFVELLLYLMYRWPFWTCSIPDSSTVVLNM